MLDRDPIVRAIETPLGPLELAVDHDGRLLRATFAADVDRSSPAPRSAAAPARAVAGLDAAGHWFGAWFAGEPSPRAPRLAPAGTDFQRRVWSALASTPIGTTTTYARIAASLGRPSTHARAVGSAVGANPWAIVVPCHRVIGGDGTLTGYRWGLERKRWMLGHEATMGGAAIGGVAAIRAPRFEDAHATEVHRTPA